MLLWLEVALVLEVVGLVGLVVVLVVGLVLVLLVKLVEEGKVD